MKVVILAGGLGTRLSELTHLIPKPMVNIGSKPILCHIIEIYKKFDHKEFYIAMGYKYNIIIDYFSKISKSKIDKNIILRDGSKITFKYGGLTINLINTGKNTKTGTRIKKLKKYIKDENFLITYGDGLIDVNINKVIQFHKKNNKILTLTAVRPPARFGELVLSGANVKKFDEKPQLQRGWINGGFFVANKKFFDFIESNEMLEREPINRILNLKELNAFKHEGFWYCMDNIRDKEVLERLLKNKNTPWM